MLNNASYKYGHDNPEQGRPLRAGASYTGSVQKIGTLPFVMQLCGKWGVYFGYATTKEGADL